MVENPALILGGALVLGMMIYFISIQQKPGPPVGKPCTITNVKVSAMDAVKKVFFVSWDGPDTAIASTIGVSGVRSYFSEMSQDTARTIVIQADTAYFAPGSTYDILVQCRNDPQGISATGQLTMPPKFVPPPPPPFNIQCTIRNATITSYRADVQNWQVRWFGTGNVVVSMQKPAPRVFPLATANPNTCFIPITPDMTPGSYTVTLTGCNSNMTVTVTLVVPYLCKLGNVWLSAFDPVAKRWTVTWDGTPDVNVNIEGVTYQNTLPSSMQAYIPWNPSWSPGSSHVVIVSCKLDPQLKRSLVLTTPSAATPTPLQPKNKPIPINPPKPPPTPSCFGASNVQISPYDSISKQWIVTWAAGIVTELVFYNVSAPSVAVFRIKPDDPTGKAVITADSISALPAGVYNVKLMCLEQVGIVQITKGSPPPSPTGIYTLKSGGTVNGKTVYYLSNKYNYDQATLSSTRWISVEAWSDPTKTRPLTVVTTKYEVLNGMNYSKIFVDLGDFNTTEIAKMYGSAWVKCTLANDWGTVVYENY